MADKIRLLPEVVANQIAAGEVVNRPASVVKEMMENAIDAGARTVKVNFRDGGKDLIQIVDDGSGMSPIDARMAFDRHATSKITSVEDIYALNTFGFRGEALASIAAVAQVELRTRQEGDEVGTQTEINGGQFAGQTPVMCPVGAQFFVRNLFTTCPPAAVSSTRVRLRPHRSRPNSSVLRCATPISPSNFTPTTLRSIRSVPRRWRDVSLTWWDAISSRTCWRSMPTPRSPASGAISAVRLPPSGATASSTSSSTDVISRVRTSRAPS